MRVFAISDLHLTFGSDKPMDKFGKAWFNQTEILKKSCDELLSDDDVLLIAGDISWAMREQEAIADLEYIGSLKGKKVLIRGNHDYWWNTISKVRRLLPHNVFAVHNDAIRLGKLVVGGNRGIVSLENGASAPKGLTKEQYNKQFERELVRFDMSINAMKQLAHENDKMILLTHFPPFNNAKQKSVFCEKFEQAGLTDVVFGHIHLKNINSKFWGGVIHQSGGVRYWLTSCDVLEHRPILIYEDD